ncbi:MAG TPA: alpha/beta hydrolase [Steroidobacteraceae bacterium]|nr:alpha/beta hydrolase [Steroidobacteraceae bacterium]
MVWHETGGSGSRTILLLHGLGATAAVWSGVERALERASLGSWIAPDLSGHGSSAGHPHYSVGQLAADLVELVREVEGEVLVVGHSLGAYVGLALASGWFGVEVAGVLGVGPKISWSPRDLERARELSERPLRWYSSSEEAWARYRRVSGLDAQIAPEEYWLARGVKQAESGWLLAQDSLTFGVAGAPFKTLCAASRARVLLARGERDGMVSNEELRQYAQQTAEIAGAGHNAHVEKPEALVSLLEKLVNHA